MLRPVLSPTRSRALAALAVAAAALLGSGCSMFSSSEEVRVRVSSKADTNGGLPFYVVFRSVEGSAFVTESYDSVSRKVFANPKDTTVLRSDVIYPGVDKEIHLDRPQALPLAIFFMFTKPGERWKTMRAQPVPASIDIDLEQNGIKKES